MNLNDLDYSMLKSRKIFLLVTRDCNSQQKTDAEKGTYIAHFSIRNVFKQHQKWKYSLDFCLTAQKTCDIPYFIRPMSKAVRKLLRVQEF